MRSTASPGSRTGHRGLGRRSTAAAEAISARLRRSPDRFVRRRRRIAGLNLATITAFIPVAAYQFGLIRHLPEPPLPSLGADRVDASGEAYALLHTPDAALGIANAAATLVLAGMTGSSPTTPQSRWRTFALAAKVLADAAGAAVLTAEQATKHRRFCGYCLLGSAFTLSGVLPALQLAAATVRRQTASGD